MEERLDDAINVLRNHAECQSVPPQFSGSVPVGSQFHQYHVVRINGDTSKDSFVYFTHPLSLQGGNSTVGSIPHNPSFPCGVVPVGASSVERPITPDRVPSTSKYRSS